MKQSILFFLLSFSMTAIFAQAKKTPPAKPAPAVSASMLKTRQDSLSYAIGLLDGNFFKMQGITSVNAQMLGKGFDDQLKGKTALTPEQADQIVRGEMQKMTKAKIQPNIDAGNRYCMENAKKPGVKTTASGLQYEVIKMGDGPKPKDTSVVRVHYDGYTLDGKKFDSSRDRGEPTEFPLNGVIKGWTEGVQLMPVGSRFKFTIPANLAYGDQGAGEAIKGGSTLIFDVELLSIVNKTQQ